MANTVSSEEEEAHFRKVIAAYRNYRKDSKARLQRTMDYLKQIPSSHQNMLSQHGYQENLKAVENCVDANADILAAIVSDVDTMFENPSAANNANNTIVQKSQPSPTALADIEKIQSTLKQFVRDWSAEGQAERDQCYKPIIETLEKIFGSLSRAERSKTKILVPGAGLGRLAFEIAAKGFECQGNEFSLYMLFASNYVLNKCKQPNCCTIFPWIHQFTNNLTSVDQIRAVTIPDIDPGSLSSDGKFSMVAGDFLEVYDNDEYVKSQDCVVTCFFLDCAHNVLEFIELIHRILKPGGYWINFGPLQYHFADIARESSIEPSYDVIKQIVQKTGFEITAEEVGREAAYCQNKRSMLKYKFDCLFFTAKKCS